MARCRSQCASRRNIAVHLNLLPLRLFGPGTKEREREGGIYVWTTRIALLRNNGWRVLPFVTRGCGQKVSTPESPDFHFFNAQKKNKIVSRPLEIESTLMPEVIAFFSFPSPYIYIYIGQQLVIFSPLRSIRVLSICRNDRTVWGALHQAHLDWILSVCRYRYLLWCFPPQSYYIYIDDVPFIGWTDSDFWRKLFRNRRETLDNEPCVLFPYSFWHRFCPFFFFFPLSLIVAQGGGRSISDLWSFPPHTHTHMWENPSALFLIEREREPFLLSCGQSDRATLLDNVSCRALFFLTLWEMRTRRIEQLRGRSAWDGRQLVCDVNSNADLRSLLLLLLFHIGHQSSISCGRVDAGPMIGGWGSIRLCCIRWRSLRI